MVKLTTPGFNWPVPLEGPITGYSSQATADPGQSYISYDGSSGSWQDITTISWCPECNVCLKALTTSVSETVSTPSTLSGPTSGVTGLSYPFMTGGSSSNSGHSVQYLFDWGDRTNSGWLSVGTTSASKSWSKIGTYIVKAQARCATHTLAVSSWSEGLTVTLASPIALQSPADGAVFDSCSLINKYQSSFKWSTTGTFTKYTILFSTSSSFSGPFAKATIQRTRNSWTPPSTTWKKIMSSSYNNGNIQDIYWKVIGTKPDKTTIESEVRSFRVGKPQAVTLQSPANHTVLPAGTPPTFDFGTNCNTKFKLEISSLIEFGDPKKIKGFSYTVKDPNVNTTLLKTLTAAQWNAVKKLVGSGTGYYRIRAWDGINRESVSEVRAFTVQ